MSKYIIEKYLEKNIEIEDFIQENGTVFHQYNFLSAVGVDYLCIGIREVANNEIVGILPLVKSVKFKLKSYHIPPYAYQFGPIVSREQLKNKSQIFMLLLNEIKNSAQIDFKILIEDNDILEFKNNYYSIEANQTHFFSSKNKFNIELLAKDKRRDLKKLMRLVDEGELQVIENNDVAKTHIYELWNLTAQRSKFNAHLDVLQQIFNSKIKFYCNVILDNEGKALAGTFCPYDNKTMYHLIGASSRVEDKLKSRSNIISLYYAILNANQNELNFDYEGSNIEGVSNFYRSMAGQPIINYRIQKTKSVYYNILKGVRKIKQFYL